MQHQIKICVFFILFTCAFAKFVFDTNIDRRCLTPHNRPGECVPLYNCSTLYNAFLKKKTNDAAVKEYLRQSHCGHVTDSAGKPIPTVCCEQDAGPCNTPDDEIGACVPISRCNPLLQYLENQPLLSGNVISYLQQSACTYTDPAQKKEEKTKNRICCPIITRNKTETTSDRFTTSTKPTNYILNDNKTIDKELISDLNKIANKRKVKLPKPGDEEGQCGVREIDDRILRYETDIYDHPWSALIRYKDRKWGCSASIITNKYVLTGAQCVQKEIDIIRVGDWDTSTENDCIRLFGYEECSEDPIDIEPDTITPHQNFSMKPLRNDIALIRLKNTLPFTDFIRPICLPELLDFLDFNHLSLIGWKRKGNDRKKEFLSPLQLYDDAMCSKEFEVHNPSFEVQYEQFCGIARNKTWKPYNNTCTTEIGGPVLAYKAFHGIAVVSIQVGIVSINPEECGKIDKPSLFTDVGKHLEWIQENLRP